jgi:PRTRC genetic system protein B
VIAPFLRFAILFIMKNENNTTIRYAEYLRKSTDDKEKQVLSLSSQRDVLDRLKHSHKLNIFETIEEKKSAKRPGRPGFNTLIKQIKTGNINGIVTWAPHRLSKNSVDNGELISLFDTGHLKEVVTENYVYRNTPMDIFMLGFQGLQAKFENDNKALDVKGGMLTQEAGKNSFLKCRGILPANLLYLNTAQNGYAVWFTPTRERQLFFKDGLDIPSGMAKVPAMLWKGSKDSLSVFALKGNRKPLLNTPLFHAPYFNMHPDGKVCMGTVRLKIDGDTCLEDFIGLWESYFFNSYFSHTIEGGSLCAKNIVQIWQEQLKKGSPFPEIHLTKSGKTLADLIA